MGAGALPFPTQAETLIAATVSMMQVTNVFIADTPISNVSIIGRAMLRSLVQARHSRYTNQHFRCATQLR